MSKKRMGRISTLPWVWQNAMHGEGMSSRPRTIVSAVEHQFSPDGRDLGRKSVLIPGVKMVASLAEAVEDIQLEIHGSPEDEEYIIRTTTFYPALFDLCRGVSKGVDLKKRAVKIMAAIEEYNP